MSGLLLRFRSVANSSRSLRGFSSDLAHPPFPPSPSLEGSAAPLALAFQMGLGFSFSRVLTLFLLPCPSSSFVSGSRALPVLPPSTASLPRLLDHNVTTFGFANFLLGFCLSRGSLIAPPCFCVLGFCLNRGSLIASCCFGSLGFCLNRGSLIASCRNKFPKFAWLFGAASRLGELHAGHGHPI